MEVSALFDQVRQFIAANYFFGRDEELGDDASFLEEGILDSTGVLQLIAFLEETYGIKVENEETIPDNLDSIRKVTLYLSGKLSPQPEELSPLDGNQQVRR